MYKYILILLILAITCLAAISLISKYLSNHGSNNKKKPTNQ